MKARSATMPVLAGGAKTLPLRWLRATRSFRAKLLEKPKYRDIQKVVSTDMGRTVL
jgi:hypothetical protein